MSTVDIIQAFKEMPFYGCPDFDIIVKFTSARDRITSLMNDIGAARFVRPAGIFEQLNSGYNAPCHYYEEEQFTCTIECKRKPTSNLNIFSFNIRSLAKHGTKLLAYLASLPKFDILVLTEIR